MKLGKITNRISRRVYSENPMDLGGIIQQSDYIDRGLNGTHFKIHNICSDAFGIPLENIDEKQDPYKSILDEIADRIETWIKNENTEFDFNKINEKVLSIGHQIKQEWKNNGKNSDWI